MKHTLKLSVAACVLILSILACNAPTSPSSSQPDYVATITAQAAELAQPTVTLLPGPTTDSAASKVIANLTAATNCRSGPGASYSLIASLSAGQQVVVVGKDTADNYWIVNNPNGNDTCWLWGQYATVTGDPSGLPQVSPPTLVLKPTKTPKPVAVATNTQGTLPVAPHSFDEGNTELTSCSATSNKFGGYDVVYNVSIEWVDTDPSIQGYKVYQGSSLLATLPPNIHKYLGSGKVTGNKSATNIPFTAEAFNAAGSSSADLNLSCP